MTNKTVQVCVFVDINLREAINVDDTETEGQEFGRQKGESSHDDEHVSVVVNV